MMIGAWGEVPEKPWWQTKYEIENRPEWGQYFCNLDNMLEPNSDWVIYGWVSVIIPFKDIEMEELYELTQWCKENIDNVWEGPIGYLGIWKFRFTTEEDRLAFKLRK